MKLTIEQALALPELKEVKVKAGHRGLGSVISSVDVMEVPDVSDWVREGELLLTTAYALRDDLNALTTLLPRLSERGVVGLAIKTGRYINCMPADMLQVADSLGFPLLELPKHIRYVDILNALLEIILDNVSIYAKQSEAIHHKMSQLLLSGGGVDTICETLSDLLSADIAITGNRGEILSAIEPEKRSKLRSVIASARQGERVELSGRALRPLRKSRDLLSILLTSDEQNANVISSGIEFGGKLYGTLWVWNLNRAVTELDLIVIDRATTYLAIKLMQQTSLREVELGHLSGFLNDILSGRLETEASIRERSEGFNWDPSLSFAVALVKVEQKVSGQRLESLNTSTPSESIDRQLLGAVLSVVRRIPECRISWINLDKICILLPCEMPKLQSASLKNCTAVAEKIKELLVTEFVDLSIWIGIGRPKEAQVQLKDSLQEAILALNVSQQISPDGTIFDFEKLGIYRLFCGPRDGEDLSNFIRHEIDALIVYDTENNSDLLKTLDTYLREDRRIQRTASKLSIHPNTLKYRLSQIESLIGPFRQDPDKQLALEVAIRLYQIQR